MGNRFKRLPSPSMAVAFVALLAALGGTAVALPGKNGVKSDDIAKNAVDSANIVNNTIKGADVRPNTLTGTDINEGSLGAVPTANHASTAAFANAAASANTASTAATANSATTASSANTATTATTAGSIGGVELRKLQFAATGDVAETTILSFKNLVLKAACTGSTTSFQADTTVNNAFIQSYTVNTTAAAPENDNEVADPDFDVADADLELLPTTNEDNEVGSLRYSRPDGGGVQLSFHVTDTAAAPCAVNGTATGF